MPQRPTAEELAREFGGVVAPQSPTTTTPRQAPTAADLAKEFGGVVEPTPPPGANTGFIAGAKKAASAAAGVVMHPLDFFNSMWQELKTPDTELLERGKRAKTEAEAAGGTGLDPWLHGALGSLRFVGPMMNELTMQSGHDRPGQPADFPGAVGEALTTMAIG